jgi:hypothetical protein
MSHQCLKSFDKEGNFKGHFNPQAPRFMGCFMRLKFDKIPVSPWIYCSQCIMSDPVTGHCEKGSGILSCDICDHKCPTIGRMLCPGKMYKKIKEGL